LTGYLFENAGKIGFLFVTQFVAYFGDGFFGAYEEVLGFNKFAGLNDL